MTLDEASGPPNMNRVDVFKSSKSVLALFFSYIAAMGLFSSIGETMGPEVFKNIDSRQDLIEWTLVDSDCRSNCKFSFNIPITSVISEMQVSILCEASRD